MSGQANYRTLVDDILDHCIFALGCGAEMNIKLDAITRLRDHVRGPFLEQVSRERDPNNPQDGDPGLDRWNAYSRFLLDCCVTIGALAAAKAISRGSSVIEFNEDLKEAYNAVSRKNSAQPRAWCPNMD